MEHSENCTETVEVAEKARVSFANTKDKYVAGRAAVIECISEGGRPLPFLEARIEVFDRVTELEALEDRSVGDTSRMFTFTPHVEERTDKDTFVFCEAVQIDSDGEEVFKESVSHHVNIVYPPQPQDDIIVYAKVNESVQIELLVEAYPLPDLDTVTWVVEDQNISQSIRVGITQPEIQL